MNIMKLIQLTLKCCSDDGEMKIGDKKMDDFPISSIEFDYKPNAPRVTRPRNSDVGNLYENMAKQLAAFLDIKESRHPKMVDVTLTNETHVDIIAGGDDDGSLDISDLHDLSSNSLPVTDIESHGNLVKTPNKRMGESEWEPLMVIDSLPDDKSERDTEGLQSKLIKVPDVGKVDNTVSNWKPFNHERD